MNRVTLESRLLDVNKEQTPFAAASALTIAAAAAGCAMAALRGRARTRHAWPLAGLLAGLAVDEYVVVHERRRRRAPAAGAVPRLGQRDLADRLPAGDGSRFLLFIAVARHASDEGRRRLLVGLGLLVAAMLAEVVSAPFSTDETAAGLVHALEGAVEEACELGGWGLLTVATLRLAVGARE
ncbi:MAG: hypothetical protein M3P95_09750 [Actinomycetota bacterium]|nr:hypothetical protein [Actinomycetota bacterium]